jgi:hypothetical protein
MLISSPSSIEQRRTAMADPEDDKQSRTLWLHSKDSWRHLKNSAAAFQYTCGKTEEGEKGKEQKSDDANEEEKGKRSWPEGGDRWQTDDGWNSDKLDTWKWSRSVLESFPCLLHKPGEEQEADRVTDPPLPHPPHPQAAMMMKGMMECMMDMMNGMMKGMMKPMMKGMMKDMMKDMFDAAMDQRADAAHAPRQASRCESPLRAARLYVSHEAEIDDFGADFKKVRRSAGTKASKQT